MASKIRSMQQHRADRLVAAAQALGDGHEVGRDSFLLAGVQRAGAAHAAHDFVEDEQHAISVADRADASEIIADRRHGARGRADDRLGDEGDHLVGAEFEDFVLQRLRRARGVVRVRLAFALAAIGEARLDMVGLDQQRVELSRAAIHCRRPRARPAYCRDSSGGAR